MREDSPIDNNRFLRTDAANLPSILYLYKQRFPTAYHRIVAAVKAIAPFFDDFVLEPLRLNPKNIALQWRSKWSDYEFGAHQLSDGTLRDRIIHSVASAGSRFAEVDRTGRAGIGTSSICSGRVGRFVKSTAQQSQLLIATQSVALVDRFDVNDVVTANLREGCTTFERLDSEGLKDWLDDYTLSELWEKNVIGGGPY